jgi:CheY-like chemotaxis protein
VAAVQQQPYDLVLMDVQMPEMDGLQATERIRQDASAPQPGIYALTASALTEDVEECLAAGMDGVLTKPLSVEALRSLLQRQGEHIRGDQP